MKPKMKHKPDKLRIVTVKGPRFEQVIRSAQQYMARIVIKKLDEQVKPTSKSIARIFNFNSFR